MIYVEPPWSLPDRLDPTNASKTPLITSWLDALPPLLTPSRDGLAKLIDNYLVPCTELVRLQLYQPVAAAPSNLVAALLRMLEALLLPYWPHCMVWLLVLWCTGTPFISCRRSLFVLRAAWHS